jgi:hypothetical protein
LLDRDIREFLKKHFKEKMFVDEVNTGKARIDLLDLSTELHGYEIKSDVDTFSRLDRQIRNYNKTLSKITIVVGAKKLPVIESKVPAFWGIILVHEVDGKVILHNVRNALSNPSFDKRVAICTLWKSELLDIISNKFKVSARSRYVKMRRWRLASILERELDADETIKLIRISYLKRIKEGGWRDQGQ